MLFCFVWFYAVPCPVCTTLVPSRSVNAHLDRCLRQEDHKPSLPSLPSASRTTASSCQSVVLVDSDGKSNVANMSRATPMLPVPAPKKDPRYCPQLHSVSCFMLVPLLMACDLGMIRPTSLMQFACH